MSRSAVAVFVCLFFLGNAYHGYYYPADGCPSPAIGSISFPPGDDYKISSGTYVNEESREENGVLLVRFYRPAPKAESLVVIDVRKRKAYTTFGKIKRRRNIFCVI